MNVIFERVLILILLKNCVIIDCSEPFSVTHISNSIDDNEADVGGSNTNLLVVPRGKYCFRILLIVFQSNFIYIYIYIYIYFSTYFLQDFVSITGKRLVTTSLSI